MGLKKTVTLFDERYLRVKLSKVVANMMQYMFELTTWIEFWSTLLSPIEDVNHADDVVQWVAIAEATSFENMRLIHRRFAFWDCWRLFACLLAYVIARFGVCLYDFVSRKKGLKPAGSVA